MKRIIIALLLISAFALSACTNAQNSTSKNTTASDNNTLKAATADEAVYDPYSVENKYDIPDSYFEKKSGVDYGTVLKDVTYYSTTAGDNKQCNILLPAGYDESQTYPVMYIFHGFSGSHSDQIDDDSYVTLLYGATDAFFLGKTIGIRRRSGSFFGILQSSCSHNHFVSGL